MKYLYTLLISVSIVTLNAQQFTTVTQQIGIQHTYNNSGSSMGSGVAFFDFDNDNDEDLIFTGGLGFDKLYRNDGNGNFTDITANSGLVKPNGTMTIGIVTGDIDNDGLREIFMTTTNNQPNRLYKNIGNGQFLDMTTFAGIDKLADGSTENQRGFSASMGDFNADGFLDIYIVNWIDTFNHLYDSVGTLIGFAHVGGANRLYLNNGDLTFTEVAAQYGVADNGSGLASVFTDYDNDRDMDLMAVNDFGGWTVPDALFQNQYPLDTFYDVGAVSGANNGIYGMGVGVGDYDQDGDLDYYKTNIGRNVLLNNMGNATFQDTTTFAGVEDTYTNNPQLAVGWGAGFFDYNHDTYLDLVVANGRIGSPTYFPATDSMPDRLFQNMGNGTFTEVGNQASFINYGLSRGMAYGDIDNDGDQDVVFTCVQNFGLGIQPFPVVFRNDLDNSNQTNNWLKVKLEGTNSNKDALGTHLTIHVNGKSWLHEVNSGGQGHSSQHSTVAHFGLDAAMMIDSLVVEWVNNSSPKQVFTDIPANRMIKIIEGTANYTTISTTTKSIPSILTNLKTYPNPSTDFLTIDFTLEEKTPITIFLTDMNGRLIKTIQEGTFQAGIHQIEWQNSNLISGIYTVLLKTDSGVVAEKIVVVK